MDDCPCEDLQPRLLKLSRWKWRKVVLRLSSETFPTALLSFSAFFPKMIFLIIMHPRVMLWIQCIRRFYVSHAKHLFSVERVNDHPRWTASLPLTAACDCSKWEAVTGRQTKVKVRDRERESSACEDIFHWKILHFTPALKAFDETVTCGFKLNTNPDKKTDFHHITVTLSC